jgi:hypothetical protein
MCQKRRFDGAMPPAWSICGRFIYPWPIRGKSLTTPVGNPSESPREGWRPAQNLCQVGVAAYHRSGEINMTDIPQNLDYEKLLESEWLAIERALREAVNETIATHKRLGLPMVEWHDGQVVWVPADKLDLSNDAWGCCPHTQQ